MHRRMCTYIYTAANVRTCICIIMHNETECYYELPNI